MKRISYLLLALVLVGLVAIIIVPSQWLLISSLLVASFLFGAFFYLLPLTKGTPPEQELAEAQGDYPSLDSTLLLAERTRGFLREGLTEDSALVVAEIIKEISAVAAVAITDTDKVLAFVGEGCEKHPAGKPIVTKATRDAIKYGRSMIVRNKEGFNCLEQDCLCPLESAVIMPITNKDEVVGTLKLYETKHGTLPEYIIRLAAGLAQILSMQLELVDLERQAQLTTEAQLDALQAQINPHFLFNALNTINMYILKDPEYARYLLVRLSTLLRYLLGNSGRFISVREEIKYIDNYVVIEEARFIGKIRVLLDIDEEAKNCSIPVFTIQPLVNNAILHGVLPKVGPGIIQISAHRIDDEVIIAVEDNGIGIPEEYIEKIFEPRYGSGCGVGISNVNERLRILYGEEYGLHIESEDGKGTKAWFRIPYQQFIEEQVIECE